MTGVTAGHIDLNTYDVIDSDKLERDFREEPGSIFSHPALAQSCRIARALSDVRNRRIASAALLSGLSEDQYIHELDESRRTHILDLWQDRSKLNSIVASTGEPGALPKFKDHFSTRAADYAAYRPTYPNELAEYLAALPAQPEIALDCGCGGGELSVLLASVFDRVIATDASARQIAHAASHPKVQYRHAPAERSGLADASVDLISAAQAAHWFDLDPFYFEARRVLRAGGALVLITYGVIEADGHAGEILSRFYREILGRFWPAERRHVETGYRMLPFPFREEDAPAIAMTMSWTLAQLLGYVDTWSAMRKAEEALGREPFNRFGIELGAAWGDAATRREIRWPLTIRVGRV